MTRPPAATLALIAPVPLLALVLLLVNGGVFTYTLDDAYIHLALAKNIWLGNYGINQQEASAPSSSILWPFILAPFAALPRLFEYVPLCINTVCLGFSAWVLPACFPELEWRRGLVLSFFIMLSVNMYGLVFTGMEHSLQLLLVLIVLWGLSRPELLGSKRSFELVFYGSLCALPLVRYEGLAISVPVLAYMLLKGPRKLAVISASALFLALAAFSWYLHAMGLGLLPSSVLAKSSHGGAGATFYNLLANLRAYGFLCIAVALVCHGKYARGERAFAVMLFAASVLHFLFGKFAWYGRYEVYYVVFVVVLSLREFLHLDARRWWIVLGLPLAFFGLLYPTLSTPWASANIRNQQAQMARIASILDEDVAVNDLGLVSLRSRHYVLDLWGLGSLEALAERSKAKGGAQWISDLMQKKGVHFAMVYDDWFPARPSNWIKVAELRLLTMKITAASDLVSLYATSDASAQRLRQALATFSRSSHADGFVLTVLPQ